MSTSKIPLVSTGARNVSKTNDEKPKASPPSRIPVYSQKKIISSSSSSSSSSSPSPPSSSSNLKTPKSSPSPSSSSSSLSPALKKTTLSSPSSIKRVSSSSPSSSSSTTQLKLTPSPSSIKRVSSSSLSLKLSSPSSSSSSIKSPSTKQSSVVSSRSLSSSSSKSSPTLTGPKSTLPGPKITSTGPKTTINGPNGPKSSRTINNMLPDELLLLVFIRINDVRRLILATSVCSRWKSVAGEPVLWKLLYEKQFPNKDAPPTKDWKSHFVKKSLQDFNTKFSGKLKRASITNTCEAAKLLRLSFGVKINGKEILVPQKEVSYFVFTTSVKCPNIPQIFLKDIKQIELSVGSILVNGGKTKTLVSISVKKENLISVYAAEKAPMTLYRIKQEGYDFVIGVFPGEQEVGFLHITCFHLNIFHSILSPSVLVNKPLPCHYKPTFDDLDRDYGLRNYEISIVLRSSGKVRWSSYFVKVDFESIEQKKYVRFIVLDGTSKPHMAHSFEGNFGLPWKTETFSNTITNTTIIDWMLIDGNGAPMWLESSPVFLVPAGSLPNSTLTQMATIYDLPEGEITEFKFENNSKGKVEIRTVFSEREKRTTLWEFVFILHSSFVNSWFLTSY